jgi:hypothetical protein
MIQALTVLKTIGVVNKYFVFENALAYSEFFDGVKHTL